MNCYCHATSFENAQKIEVEGFHLGQNGMFGGGIYFSEMPEEAVRKARVSRCDCIIVATLNVGRLLTEEMAMNHFNKRIVNKDGYDSVQMTHCRTGAEICIYEPSRVTIVCIVHWDSSSIEFKGENLRDKINLNDFRTFINGRTIKLNPPNQEALIYKDKSPEEIKARRYKRLDDLETYLLNEKNHTILTDPWFKNPADACMKTLRNYLHHHIQFRDEFPELKDELDYRINRLISTLNSQIVKNKEFQSRAACLLAGIAEVVKSNDCKDEMISTLRNFLRNHRIEGPLDYFDNTDGF